VARCTTIGIGPVESPGSGGRVHRVVANEADRRGLGADGHRTVHDVAFGRSDVEAQGAVGQQRHLQWVRPRRRRNRARVALEARGIVERVSGDVDRNGRPGVPGAHPAGVHGRCAVVVAPDAIDAGEVVHPARVGVAAEARGRAAAVDGVLGDGEIGVDEGADVARRVAADAGVIRVAVRARVCGPRGPEVIGGSRRIGMAARAVPWLRSEVRGPRLVCARSHMARQA